MTTHKILLLSFILCTLAVMDQLPLSPHHMGLSAADGYFLVSCSEGEVVPDDALQALGGLEIFCSGETGDDYLIFADRVTYYFHSAFAYVYTLQWSDGSSRSSCSKKFVQDCISQIEAKCGKDGKGTASHFPYLTGCGRANRGDLF
ncbi:hypothetical protein BDV23DRAFT_161934 [Aspergillus alliaceus]|uniref:Uncharacterized protein n=1 Tax=Petromyces alliaceus TaxID=209559 RepID=A0A5N7BZ44_PETAA|nr:hypothetical protein BDV23DRAFT_161934 [Aspergillus alliaceus]